MLWPSESTHRRNETLDASADLMSQQNTLTITLRHPARCWLHKSRRQRREVHLPLLCAWLLSIRVSRKRLFRFANHERS